MSQLTFDHSSSFSSPGRYKNKTKMVLLTFSDGFRDNSDITVIRSAALTAGCRSYKGL